MVFTFHSVVYLFFKEKTDSVLLHIPSSLYRFSLRHGEQGAPKSSERAPISHLIAAVLLMTHVRSFATLTFVTLRAHVRSF